MSIQKTRSDGSIERYKARLVAIGFQQTHACDYNETFASVAYMTTVHTLIAKAATSSWDMSVVALYDDLNEEVATPRC